MCGLSGVAGSISVDAESACEDLLYYNHLRGKDSTGVAFIPRDKNSQSLIAKGVFEPWVLLDTKTYDKGHKKICKAIIQHNRAATVGPKKIEYAHPWSFTNIIGAHNGTVSLSQTKDLTKVLEGEKEFDSDSYGILYSIDKVGVEQTLSKIYGAWALVWYDFRDNTINFIRNSERTLFYSMDIDKKMLFWSSELEHLASAMVRNKIRRNPEAKSFPFTADTWYQFTIPDIGKSFDDPVRTIVKGKTFVRKSYEYDSDDWTGWEFVNGVWKEKEKKKVEIDKTLSSDAQKIKSDDDPVSKTIPNKASQKINKMGKDKYRLIYKDLKTRIYYDFNRNAMDRYYWSPSETKYYYTELPSGVTPAELKGVDISSQLNGTGGVIINRPFGTEIKSPLDSAPERDNEFSVLEDPVTKIRRTKDKSKWLVYFWKKEANVWSCIEHKNVPKLMPDTMLDICSRGNYFKWRGKGDKRRVLYKASKGWEIKREDFNQYTSTGCFNCGRTPYWGPGRFGGVIAHFFSRKGDFLCEYCGEDKELLKYLRDKSQSEAHENHSVVTH